MDDIHFLITELEENIQHKIQDVLKDLEKPKPQRQNPLLKRFTEELIFAAARKQHPIHQQKKEAKEFQQLKDVEQQPLPQQQIFILQQAPQPFYNREQIPAPPPQPVMQQWTAAVQQQQNQTSQPFQPSQLPASQPQQQQPQAQPKTPTDETLPFTPSAFSPQPTPQTPPPLQSIPVPQPQAPQLTPIAVTVPKEIEPPIALIVDAESNKPIVTVSMQNDVYTINEPQLSQQEVSMITWLRKKYVGKEKKLSNKKKLSKKIWKAAKKMKFQMRKNDESEYLKMKYYLVKHVLSFGWIEPLFHDDAITKMICGGENLPITIVRKEKTLKTNIAYPSAEYINVFLKKFAAKAYKQASEKNPAIDITANGFHVEGSLKTAATPAKFTVTRV